MHRRKKLPALPEIPPRRYFPIREASSLCGVNDYTLRFWEKEFPQLRPIRRGSHRAYRSKDILIARRIRELVHGDGFRIDAAKQILAKEVKENSLGASDTPPIPTDNALQDVSVTTEVTVFDSTELDAVIYNLEKLEEFLHN